MSEKVSILARPEGRALFTFGTDRTPGMQFQSSPAPKDGRYLPLIDPYEETVKVSILARPEGRALYVLNSMSRGLQ